LRKFKQFKSHIATVIEETGQILSYSRVNS